MAPFRVASLIAILISIAAADSVCTGRPRDDKRCALPEFDFAGCNPGFYCSKYFFCGNTAKHLEDNVCAKDKDGNVSTSKQPAQSSAKAVQSTTTVQREQIPTTNTQQNQPEQRGPISTFALSPGGPRVSISSMSDDDLQAYRDAWARITAGQMNSIYQSVARDHGDPFFFCPHGSRMFLPWHRHYIARLEEALGVPLAYWDWTQEGIPRAFSDRSYRNSNGRIVANPLFANLLPSGRQTTRNPRLRPDRYLSLVAFAQSQDGFEDFTQSIESVHDIVHGSTGASMASISTAAYDPIFWAHHCFVDLQWWIWQVNHPDATYTRDAMGSMRDSTGSFSGSTWIADQSAWQQGRSADMVSRATASSVLSEPQLFLVLKKIPTTRDETEVSVYLDNVKLASDVRLGMAKMTSVRKDFTLVVDTKDLLSVWAGKNITLEEEIPKRATVWQTVNGKKFRVEGIEIEAKWHQ